MLSVCIMVERELILLESITYFDLLTYLLTLPCLNLISHGKILQRMFQYN